MTKYSSSNFQARMFAEMKDKEIFEQVKSYAFEYANASAERNIFPDSHALQNLEIFREKLPDRGTDAKEVLEQLHTLGSPATVNQIGGRYYGFVNGGVVPTALAAKWLASFWDQNAALEVMSPLVSQLESVVEDWIRDLLGFPSSTAAGFVSGTTVANFCALAAARYRIFEKNGWDLATKGMYGAPRIRIVAGEHIHASVKQSIVSLGFGTEQIVWVEVDEQGRMRPDKLPPLDANTILLLQAGNVNSGAFDPFDEICTRARAAEAWVHIDGAFGLWAAGVDKFQDLSKGMAKANSWSVDGHKTLNTPYDCGIVLCEDREALISALHATGAYLVYGEKRDGMLYTPSMSRRARIVELWALIKYLGKAGIAEMIEGLHERAQQFAEELTSAGFSVLNDVVFNQVLVACETDELTEACLANIQQLRTCWCGGSLWFGKKVIRISICSWATSPEDVHRSVHSFIEARNMVRSASANT